MSDNGTKTDAEHRDPPLRRLRLNTIAGARVSYARIIRLYDRGEISESKYRNLVYGLSGFLAYLKSEREMNDFDERLRILEESAGV